MGNIVYNIDTEIRRIAYILEKIKVNFYQENNFLLVDKVPGGRADCVYYPRFTRELNNEIANYIGSQMSTYVDSVKSTVISDELKQKISEVISPLMLSETEVKEFTDKWRKIKKEFFSLTETIFDFSRIDFTICPTRFGTATSSISLNPEENKMIVYFRVDADMSNLAAMMLTSLMIKDGLNRSKDMWRQREMMIDYLFSKTKLNKLFPKYFPTLKVLENVVQDKSLIIASNGYYEYLGFPVAGVMTLVDDNVLVNGIQVDLSKYTELHICLLKHFLKNAGKTVSYEDIAHVIWKDKWVGKYSIWAISKHISYLRRMFKDWGVNPNRLQTFKKRGFVFK